jgi:hypothetical protein
MKPRGLIPAAIGAVVFAAICFVWPMTRLAAASQREREAAAAFQQVLDAERQMLALRSTVATSRLAKPPEGDVAAAVQSALRDAGLSVQLLAEVSPQEASTLAGSQDPSAASWRRQSVVVRFQPMPLPDLGAFLDRWRAAHRDWSIAQIDLQASELRSQAEASRVSSFSPRLTLLTTYLDRAEP